MKKRAVLGNTIKWAHKKTLAVSVWLKNKTSKESLQQGSWMVISMVIAFAMASIIFIGAVRGFTNIIDTFVEGTKNGTDINISAGWADPSKVTGK